MLSVCIPTHNRRRFLEYTLNRLLQWAPMEWEIIIGENVCTDDTYHFLQHHPLKERFRVIHHTQKVGAEDNLFRLVKEATKPFVTYLADDDEFISDELMASLKVLEASRASALFAPWEMWSGLSNSSGGMFYTPNPDHTLQQAIFEDGLLPEIGIYLTSDAKEVLINPRTAHWGFVALAKFIQKSGVVLHDRPFYRSIFNHPLDPHNQRPQEGRTQAINHLDRYRAGLEYLAGSQGWCGAWVQQQINKLMRIRMGIGVRLADAAGDAATREELRIRLRAHTREEAVGA